MSLRRVPRPTRNGVGASPCSTFLTTCLAKPSPQRASDFGVVARAPSSGHRIRFHFCPNCGSTLYWEGERNPPVYAVAVGAFDRSAFPPPSDSIWEESMHPGSACPRGWSTTGRGDYRLQIKQQRRCCWPQRVAAPCCCASRFNLHMCGYGYEYPSASEGSMTVRPRHRHLVQSRSPFINRSRIDRSSSRRSALISGYVISSPLSVSRII
jgi:hypothetical protein